MDGLDRLVRRRCRFAGPSFVERVTAAPRTADPDTEAPAMQYALLIYTTEPTEEVPAEAMEAEMAEYNRFTQHVAERGAFKAGEALFPTAMATTVRVRDGQTLTTDGPFAETKEALGGLYIVEAADLDEAIGYAAMIPGAKHGSIEVRPIVDFGDGSAAATAEAVSAG
jgi:hypothetical protein